MTILLSMLAAAVVPSGQTFSCTPTAVYDGDGPIWCKEGPRIRLSGIAAREMDGTCRPNQPCPEVSAERSRDAILKLIGVPIGRKPQGHILVRGPTMRCRSERNGVGKKTAAWCVSPKGGDVSCVMSVVAGRSSGRGTGRGIDVEAIRSWIAKA